MATLTYTINHRFNQPAYWAIYHLPMHYVADTGQRDHKNGYVYGMRM